MSHEVSYSVFQARLKNVGLDNPRTLEATEITNADVLFGLLYPSGLATFDPVARGKAQEMLDGVGRAAQLARLADRPKYEGGVDLALWAAREERRKRDEAMDQGLKRAIGASSSGPTASAVRWHPVMKKPKRAEGLAAQDRALMERWAGQLAKALEAGNTPSWREAMATEQPLANVAGLVGCARPTTVRKRVRAWQHFIRWLEAFRSRSWPGAVSDLLDYLQSQLAEGCSESFPVTFRATVLWMEGRSGLRGEDRFAGHELFMKNVERANILMTTGALDVRKAPRFTLALIGALEVYVVGENHPLGLRILAWVRLIKVFGVLRWDDLQRIRPGDLRLVGGSLVGTLYQTKTSGAGKKVKTLPMVIPRSAYVLDAGWQEAGYALWCQLRNQGRDYFLPRLRGDLVEFFDCQATSADMATLHSLLMSHLVAPVVKKDPEDGPYAQWIAGESPLLTEPLWSGWSGHSERATMPSLFAAMGVSKQERDPLGRWSPSGSDDYVRDYKALIRGLFDKFRALLAEGNFERIIDDDDAMQCVQKFISKRTGKDEDEGVELAIGMFQVIATDVYERMQTQGMERTPVGEDGQEPRCADLAKELEMELAQEEDVAPYLIVMSKRGAVLKLHRGDGCHQARSRCFASYEVCTLDPVPTNMYTSFCRNCWPKGMPSTPEEDDDTSEDSSGSEDQDDDSAASAAALTTPVVED